MHISHARLKKKDFSHIILHSRKHRLEKRLHHPGTYKQTPYSKTEQRGRQHPFRRHVSHLISSPTNSKLSCDRLWHQESALVASSGDKLPLPSFTFLASLIFRLIIYLLPHFFLFSFVFFFTFLLRYSNCVFLGNYCAVFYLREREK